MPWASDPHVTANDDLHTLLFPIEAKDLVTTVSSCSSVLGRFRACVSSQPVHLDDHVASLNCAGALAQLQSCSERVVLESQRATSNKTPVEQARFQLQGSFA